MTALPPLSPETTLSQVLQSYPGAQRALFARYHIGGCSSCAFSPSETLAQLCQRNENLDVQEVIAHIQDSHQGDATLQISPADFVELRKITPDLAILDVRTREEHEAVTLPGARLMTQELVQEAFSAWDKNAPLILYDHTGSRSLDAVAYFIGHGFTNARCLAGGIDAYSQQVDPSLPRYKVEIEA
ncbi:rhodanese-like domain-containing protein [Prosthecobacter sp. SYSU 5D2]|uniref:rhodanese-like domain-containing protein n=1 Tax=Prosthecobacter sp. SYSU 5D2 TaxID=3134134 RepID=UPI0031FE88FF